MTKTWQKAGYSAGSVHFSFSSFLDKFLVICAFVSVNFYHCLLNLLKSMQNWFTMTVAPCVTGQGDCRLKGSQRTFGLIPKTFRFFRELLGFLREYLCSVIFPQGSLWNLLMFTWAFLLFFHISAHCRQIQCSVFIFFAYFTHSILAP